MKVAKTEKVDIRITKSQKEEIKKYCEANGKTMSAVVVSALRKAKIIS